MNSRRVALQNAASIAGMLLTTECVMCDIKEPEPPDARQLRHGRNVLSRKD